MSEELNQLAGVVAATDAGAVPPELTPDGQPVVPVNFGLEAAGAVDMFAGLVTGYAPGTADLWNAEAKARVSATLAPVLEKYGVTIGTLPPELLLLMTAGPILWQSSKIIAAQMEADKAKAKLKPATAAVEAEGGSAVARHEQEKLYSS